MGDGSDTQKNQGEMALDAGYVRELAEVLEQTGLTEIEVKDGDRMVRVLRAVTVQAAAPATFHAIAPGAPLAAAPAAGAPAAEAPAPKAAAAAQHANAIRSPMVGTAYLLPEPGADPFVAVGKQVQAGETLLIIEAMKVMNPITAPSAGSVQAILIENGQPVEYDQPLIVVA